jgi:hypothetical protein
MENRLAIKYLDNLIAWGDDLLRQDTAESFNEAALLYLVASNILGKRPRRIPGRRLAKSKTIEQLKREARGLLNTLLSSVENGDTEYLALIVRNLKLLCRFSAICLHKRHILAKRRSGTRTADRMSESEISSTLRFSSRGRALHKRA